MDVMSVILLLTFCRVVSWSRLTVRSSRSTRENARVSQ